LSIEDNPYLKIDNPYEDVKQVQDEVAKVQLEFQMLCHQVFHVSEHGKRLMELLKERYLMRPLFSPDHPQAVTQAMYWEGFKESIRGFWNFGLQHQLYINGVKSVERNTPS